MGKRKPSTGDLYTAIVVLIMVTIFVAPKTVEKFMDVILWPVKIGLVAGMIALPVYWFLTRTKDCDDTTLSTGKKPSQKHQTPFKSERHEQKCLSTTTQTTANQTEWSLALINALEWKRFEELCAAYFQEKGYRALVTRQGADGGIDINLFKASYSTTKPFGIVQCKAWKRYRVGVKPVRELYGVMAAVKVPLGVFITASSYTPQAEVFSAGKHLKLLTGQSLLQLIQSMPKKNQQNLLKNVTAGDYTTPSCPGCGTKMTLKISKKGKRAGNKFWGCRNFPRCRNTFNMPKHKQTV